MATASTTRPVDTAMKTFSKRLFTTVLLLFLAFASCVMLLQYQREKMFKTELLDTKLQDLNIALHGLIKYNGMSDSLLNDFMARLGQFEGKSIPRFTLIESDGTVIFDSESKTLMDNHSSRPEIRNAIKHGAAYVVDRKSETTQKEYFYSATYFSGDGIVIRSSLPYDVTLAQTLAIDAQYILATLLVAALMLLILYRYTKSIGKVFRQLNDFFSKASRGEDIATFGARFPANGLGGLAKHIIDLYAEIRQSEDDKARLKRQLTQNISHELKTPVSSIKGFLETVVNNPGMPEDTRTQFLKRCNDQADRLTSLLNDILTLASIEEDGSKQHERAKVNILALLDTIASETNLQLKHKGMQFLKLVSPQVNVNANPSLAYSIFRNLTDNAISYAGEGSTITVRHVAEHGGQHTFCFADNGAGVAPEHLPHLFERFYRVDKGRSRKMGGTGLGLAIVKNAVIAHGGTIQVRLSDSGGLEFLFTLPKQQ